MHVTSKSARQWNTLVLLTVGLAIAVFAWGLHYKLSMYKSAEHTVHRAAAAKLLSDRERSADITVQVERAITPVVLAFSILFSFFVSLQLEPRQQSIWLLQQVTGSFRKPDPRAMRRLFTRPPPITQ